MAVKALVCKLCGKGLIVPWPEKVPGPEGVCSWCGAEYGVSTLRPETTPSDQGFCEPKKDPCGNDPNPLFKYTLEPLERHVRKCRKGHEIPLHHSRCPTCKKDDNRKYQTELRKRKNA